MSSSAAMCTVIPPISASTRALARSSQERRPLATATSRNTSSGPASVIQVDDPNACSVAASTVAGNRCAGLAEDDASSLECRVDQAGA
jgi:hypothetical protein